MSPYEELEKLAQLKEKGIISAAEFAKKKKELLGTTTPSRSKKDAMATPPQPPAPALAPSSHPQQPVTRARSGFDVYLEKRQLMPGFADLPQTLNLIKTRISFKILAGISLLIALLFLLRPVSYDAYMFAITGFVLMTLGLLLSRVLPLFNGPSWPFLAGIFAMLCVSSFLPKTTQEKEAHVAFAKEQQKRGALASTKFDCSKVNLPATTTPVDKATAFQDALTKSWAPPAPGARVLLLEKSQFNRARCLFDLIGDQATPAQQRSMISALIRAEMFEDANTLAQSLKLTEIARDEYVSAANVGLQNFAAGRGTMDKIESYRAQAAALGATATTLQPIDKQIAFLRPAGSMREAYSLCKSAVDARLHDPSSAEYEHSTLELVAAGALVGEKICDIVNEKVCIVRIPSWVRAKNAFGAMRQTPFQCEVTFSKPSGQGTVTALNISP